MSRVFYFLLSKGSPRAGRRGVPKSIKRLLHGFPEFLAFFALRFAQSKEGRRSAVGERASIIHTRRPDEFFRESRKRKSRRKVSPTSGGSSLSARRGQLNPLTEKVQAKTATGDDHLPLGDEQSPSPAAVAVIQTELTARTEE